MLYYIIVQLAYLKSLKFWFALNLSPGSDLTPNIFFKNWKFVLSPYFLYLFNLSLYLGIFRDAWNISFICPIPNTFSNLDNIRNYRSIFLISIIPKLFESIEARKVQEYWTSLLLTINMISVLPKAQWQIYFVSNAFSSGSNVDVIHTDFTKAFDKINHDCCLIYFILLLN